MVFQSYAIWPHLDVFDNVAYPLEVERPRVARAAIEQRVMDVLALVGMETMARRRAGNNSALRWRERSYGDRACSCWMSRCQISMRGCATACGANFRRSFGRSA
jgi:ABC-type glutathione transport system ATPase component